jgi:AraC-like DNA-binding protein
MKPFLEKIQPGFDSSFFLRAFPPTNQCHEKPQWHFHPEYEIVYIEKGSGRRHIGTHVGSYQDGELIFLGPNLPHLSYSHPHRQVVLQMREDLLGKAWLDCPEFKSIRQLFERARSGLLFEQPLKHQAGQSLYQMVDAPPFERLLLLLQLLQQLATTRHVTSLSLNGPSFAVDSLEEERMTKMYTFVERNFTRHIALEEVAQLVNMTVPAFCRYFKRLTNRTFTQFVNELRITYACRLLRDSELSIAAVGYESGFNNLSHFNKQFRQYAGSSPREYRQQLVRIVG